MTTDLTQLTNELHALPVVGDDGARGGSEAAFSRPLADPLSVRGCALCQALAPNHEELRAKLLQMDWLLNGIRPADDEGQLVFVKVQTLLAQALNISKRMAGQL